MSAQKPEPSRNPAARGAARREQIIDVGVRLFAQNGWRATGLIGLANEVGITHSGVLHHFGTKENLLRAVVARRDEQQAHLRAAMDQAMGIDAIREVLPAIATDHLASKELAQLFSVLVAESFEPDQPLHGYFKDRHQGIRSYFAQALRDGQTAGQIRSEIDPDLSATAIAAFVAGIQTLWLLDPDNVNLSAVYEQHIATLLRALTLDETVR